ncbi:MAG: hypothetical protein Q9160_001935 [Pyrenula sp. 1 TL-2023]
MSRTKTYRPSETLASRHSQQIQPNVPGTSNPNAPNSNPRKKTSKLNPTEAQLARLLTLPPFSSESVIFILWYTLTTNLPSPVVASLHNNLFASSISSLHTESATEWTISDVRLHAIRVIFGGQIGIALLEVPKTPARCPCYFGIDCKENGVKKRREKGEQERADMILARRTWDVEGDADLVKCPIRRMTSQPHPTPSAPSSGSAPPLKCFTNCQLCISGELVPQDLYFSPETGTITPNYYYRSEGVERIDLGGRVVAPGFLELQINGAEGVHFTGLRRGARGDEVGGGEERDAESLRKVAEWEVRCGVTGWWATVPTVERGRWVEILEVLKPQSFPNGATLLGAHAEGPYLHPTKAGAHNASHFTTYESTTPEQLYSAHHLSSTLKLLTLAPELPSTPSLLSHLTTTYPHLRLSLGHSSSTYSTGLSALSAGASALTHVFNAMPLLHHRTPGLAGLISSPKAPYYSLIPDLIHVHPSLLTLALRASPSRCILITDALELAGLPDGVYPGHAQIPHQQRKQGNKVTIEDTETLVGSCISLDQCVRNMVAETGCGLAEAVRCVTENVAGLMGEGKRGVLEAGRRADFVVLDAEGGVRETWVQGERVWMADG